MQPSIRPFWTIKNWESGNSIVLDACNVGRPLDLLMRATREFPDIKFSLVGLDMVRVTAQGGVVISGNLWNGVFGDEICNTDQRIFNTMVPCHGRLEKGFIVNETLYTAKEMNEFITRYIKAINSNT